MRPSYRRIPVSYQRHLNLPMYGLREPLQLDGVLGPATHAAIRVFQQHIGLVVDGILGPQTRAALESSIQAANKRAVTQLAQKARPEPNKDAIRQPIASRVARFPVLSRGVIQAVRELNTGFVLVDTKRAMAEIIHHCTATPDKADYSVRDIRAWHLQRGFTDIGYHYVIRPTGLIETGRPLGQIGAHTMNQNSGTIGIAYVGGLTASGRQPADTRTAWQQVAQYLLVHMLLNRYPSITRITGHNQYAAKACPSYDVQSDWTSDITGIRNGFPLEKEED